MHCWFAEGGLWSSVEPEWKGTLLVGSSAVGETRDDDSHLRRKGKTSRSLFSERRGCQHIKERGQKGKS